MANVLSPYLIDFNNQTFPSRCLEEAQMLATITAKLEGSARIFESTSEGRSSLIEQYDFEEGTMHRWKRKL